MPAQRPRLLFCGDLDSWPQRLRDQGHEVVVLDGSASPDQLAAVAVQEDVDVVTVTDAELGARTVPAVGDEVIVFWLTSGTRPS
jgi:hypothetical protein